MFKNVPHQPLQVGDTTALSTWVSDAPAVPVVLNHDYWPGVNEGDMIEVTTLAQGERPGFLFIVPNDAGLAKQTQQQQVFIQSVLSKLLWVLSCIDNNKEDNCRHFWFHKP